MTSQKDRVIAAVAQDLAERATLTPAYLIDEETFAGWEAAARKAVEVTPRPTLAPLKEAVERAQHGQLGVRSRIFCEWCSAAKAKALEEATAEGVSV